MAEPTVAPFFEPPCWMYRKSLTGFTVTVTFPSLVPKMADWAVNHCHWNVDSRLGPLSPGENGGKGGYPAQGMLLIQMGTC